MKSQQLLRIWGICLAAIIGGLFLVWWQWPDDQVYLIMCDVGQGDAVLITHQFSQILVDTGPNEKVLSCLGKNMPFWDRSIEMVVATHPDNDHVGGFRDVLDRYFVAETFILPVGKNSTSFLALRTALLEEKKSGMHLLFPELGQSLLFDQKIKLHFLVPEVTEGSHQLFDPLLPEAQLLAILDSQEANINDYNDLSIGAIFDLDGVSFLATADQSTQVELALTQEELIQSVDILKVSHHGSKTGSSLEYLRIVQPEVSLISCGFQNSYGHPHTQVMNFLTQIGSQVYRTDIQGQIQIKIKAATYQLGTERDEK